MKKSTASHYCDAVRYKSRNENKLCIFLLVFLLLSTLPVNLFAFQTTGVTDENSLIVESLGFRYVNITGEAQGILKRRVIGGCKEENGFTDADFDGKIIGRKTAFNYIDTVPATLAEANYQYVIVGESGEQVAVSDTTTRLWPEHLFPELILPQHPDWVGLYRKAWELNWENMVTSTSLPSHYGYNDYPDNQMNYVWDACFHSLYQRYGSVIGAFLGMAVLDNFYAQQTESGYILRHYHWPTYGSGGRASKDMPRMSDVNPNLFAWAEWNYFQISADTVRLRNVLPKLVKYYRFIEDYLRTDSGKYVWNAYASGWDNILTVQPHKYWVELPATQALAARHIVRIADVLDMEDISNTFRSEADKKGKELEKYWNKDKSWFCSIGKDGSFTGKTINGMWPVLTGYVSPEKIRLMVKHNLFNPESFFTAMPLPTIAKDENGYNPKGEYWRGGVWINMSLMAIRGLDEQGFVKEALELSKKTLDGMAAVYKDWAPKRHSIWECYAPEFPAPSSHKSREKADELGTVRSEFAGWSCGLICLLIEDVMGFRVDAPHNTVDWDIRLDENFGIKRLAFGNTRTDIQIKDRILHVYTNSPYMLTVSYHGKNYEFPVKTGQNRYRLP